MYDMRCVGFESPDPAFAHNRIRDGVDPRHAIRPPAYPQQKTCTAFELRYCLF